MTSAFTITFSDTSSAVLQTHFSPEITLDEDCDYECALLDLIIKFNTKDDLKKIFGTNALIRIICDIIFGSYINGKRSHIIHQFATSTTHMTEQILVEIPKNLIYFPIKSKNLRSIQICILDSSENLLEIDGADIICRINIKREKN